jgi:enediyne polyketide synthase
VPPQDPAPAQEAAREQVAAPAQDAARARDAASPQRAIVAYDLAGARWLGRLGVEGAVGVGHSLGEIAALAWAGACDEPAALALATDRGVAIAQHGEPGEMASLGAPLAIVEELIAHTGATLAARNAADRTVVSGPPAAIAAVLAAAAVRGIAATRLKVAHAYHSPGVAAAAPALARALAAVPWAPPRRAVASTVTGALLAADADPRQLLLAQLTAPVHFADALAAARPLADLWVELGPGRTLADLAAETLGVPPLALDTGGPTLAPALAAAGALFAAGVPLALGTLFADRFTRPFDPDRPLTFLANPCESAPLPTAAAPAAAPTLANAPALAAAAHGVTAATAPPPSRSATPATPSATRPAVAPGAAETDPALAAAPARSGIAEPDVPGADPLTTLRRLVAERTALPESAIADDSRLLGDLHLNSISVGQLVVDASRTLGLPPPISPTDYAQATVAEMAQALADRLAAEPVLTATSSSTAFQGTAAAAPATPGIDTWVHPFVVRLLEQPLPVPTAHRPAVPGSPAPGTHPPPPRDSRWRLLALPDQPLAHALLDALESTAQRPPFTLPADAVTAVPGLAAGARATAAPGIAAAPPAGLDLLLCLPADLDAGDPRLLELFAAAARAATAALPPARLVVVQHQGGGGGFARSLHLERPGIATWLLDLPADLAPATAARLVAGELAAADPHGAPGYTEAHYDGRGVRRVPRLQLLELSPAGATAGLGPRDVLLVTGGGKGIGAECALAAARASGARLVILGRADPATDRDLAANLDRMGAAGAAPLYLRADVADAQALAAALARAAAAAGPITALFHAAGINRPRRLADIDAPGLRATLEPKVHGLANLLAALAGPPAADAAPADAAGCSSLRLVVAFGSIIARTGLHGEAEYALANDWMRRHLDAFAARHPACRCLTLDWSVWSGTGMGERLGTLEALGRQGITPIPPDTGVAMLLRLLAAPALRGAVVVTGRFGTPPTLILDRPPLPLLRFLENPRVHYPGIELVADSELSADSDPYLADHVFRGEPLFAAVLGLEAMAQAATALTGLTGPPVFEHVELRRPVVVPAGRSVTLRVAALVRAPGRVEAALRDSSTAFATDHFRALCTFPAAAPAAPSSSTAPAAPPAAAAPAAPPAAAAPAAPAAPSTPTAPAAPSAAPPPDPASPPRPEAPAAALPHPAIDPARDLYDSGILFHTGRFRRLASYQLLRATACVATLTPAATPTWFGRYLPATLLLGDPGARDAALHAIQACIPHAHLLPVGVERITTGRLPDDPPLRPLQVAARERHHDGATFVYDLDILGPDGTPIERWHGLALRAVQPTALPAVWTPALLAPYLERRCQELLPAAGLRIALAPVTTPSGNGRPDSAALVAHLLCDCATAPDTDTITAPDTAAVATTTATVATTTAAVATTTATDAPAPAQRFHRPDGRAEVPGAPALSVAHTAGLILAVAGRTPADPLGCDLEPVAERPPETWQALLGADRHALALLIARESGEPPATAAARVWAALEALRKAGGPLDTPLLLDTPAADGWLLLRAGHLRVATYITLLTTHPATPLAFALAARA